MIEVIKNGFMPTYEIKCLGCNSILHFIDRDEIISFKKHEHMLYGDWDYYYIICPICRHEIITRERDEKATNDYRKLIKNRIDENKVNNNENL